MLHLLLISFLIVIDAANSSFCCHKGPLLQDFLLLDGGDVFDTVLKDFRVDFVVEESVAGVGHADPTSQDHIDSVSGLFYVEDARPRLVLVKLHVLKKLLQVGTFVLCVRLKHLEAPNERLDYSEVLVFTHAWLHFESLV